MSEKINGAEVNKEAINTKLPLCDECYFYRRGAVVGRGHCFGAPPVPVMVIAQGPNGPVPGIQMHRPIVAASDPHCAQFIDTLEAVELFADDPPEESFENSRGFNPD